MGYKILLLFFI